MRNNKRKAAILKKGGFIYWIERLSYINKKKKKMFTLKAINKNDVDWLADKAKGKNREWEIYSVGTLSSYTKRNILKVI